jgi:hypothetical protein
VGQSVSLVGDGMLVVALAFAVLDLTGSVSDLGFALAASRAPLVVAVLVGGVVADRLPRRAVMVAADLVRLATLAVSSSLLIAGDARLWELFALQAVFGTAGGFFYPASTGLLPLIVGPNVLQQANALRGLSQSTGAIIGPAVAGVLVATAGPGWALAADAATFAVSAGSLALLRPPRHTRPAQQRFLGDLADGWREFRSRTWVWAEVVVAGAFANIFTAAFTANATPKRNCSSDLPICPGCIARGSIPGVPGRSLRASVRAESGRVRDNLNEGEDELIRPCEHETSRDEDTQLVLRGREPGRLPPRLGRFLWRRQRLEKAHENQGYGARTASTNARLFVPRLCAREAKTTRDGDLAEPVSDSGCRGCGHRS